jgi:hypothetical protein
MAEPAAKRNRHRKRRLRQSPRPCRSRRPKSGNWWPGEKQHHLARRRRTPSSGPVPREGDRAAAVLAAGATRSRPGLPVMQCRRQSFSAPRPLAVLVFVMGIALVRAVAVFVISSAPQLAPRELACLSSSDSSNPTANVGSPTTWSPVPGSCWLSRRDLQSRS